jgi:hypothetical protein
MVPLNRGSGLAMKHGKIMAKPQVHYYSTWFMIHTLLIIGQQKTGFEITSYAEECGCTMARFVGVIRSFGVGSDHGR